MTPPGETSRAVRKAGLVAGAGILAMAPLAVFAHFGVLENLVTEDDAARTARDIRDSEALFRFGVVALFLVAVLDVVVAWALRVFFQPAHKAIATLAAWFRLAYAGVLLVAATQLVGALPPAKNAESLGAYSADQLDAEALMRIDAFHDIWDAGLIFFGVHLLLLGFLAFRSGYVPRVLGVLLAVAGLGYLVDSFGAFLSSGYSVEAATVTGVGELLLMIWLLTTGRNIGSRLPIQAERLP
ncbi:DUF4386 domain-containing protein [Streptomyces spectabilis]|uniref:DUF4386 domain-containing protein n=1 Tax=Streptomyces spectabilis TaxID=68270 RepID=A0A516R1F8_STRST|nr:DUF4386 domain-containing protein [Streptomyces spectabilis]QDQ09482.1 DUF4386 domain-containing protein [Streptomyces spectabilis]